MTREIHIGKIAVLMNVALLGYGTVGRGVDEIVRERLGDIAVTRILELPDRLSDERMTANYDEILEDASVEAVVECMGGIEPAHSFIAAALKAKKHVITSNKAVIAAHFSEFVHLATENDVGLFMEASVAGGIPWLASLAKIQRIDNVSSFSGILNGTTNYIVYSMLKDGSDMADALSKAQEFGYAERDPSADIDGIDVANKTIITASIAFKTSCTSDLPVTGIRNLKARDLAMFKQYSSTVKLIGRGVARDGRYACAVEPMAVPLSSLEANVPLNFNLVSVDSWSAGELKFYGQGAGSLPTGNAIVQDLIDCKEGRRPNYDFTSELAYDPSLLEGDYVLRSNYRPDAAREFEPGAWLVSSLSPQAARELLDRALEDDPESLIISFSTKG